MEGEELAGFAAGSFRIDPDAAEIPFEIIRRGQDGFQRVAVVLPVDGQESGAVQGLPDNRDRHVLRLGNKRDVEIAQLVHHDHRIKNGTVVAYKEKTAFLRQLLHPADDGPDAAVQIDKRRGGIAGEAAERILLFQRLVHRNRTRDQSEEENIENVQQEKANDRRQNRKSDAQMKHRERQRKDAKQGDGCKSQK